MRNTLMLAVVCSFAMIAIISANSALRKPTESVGFPLGSKRFPRHPKHTNRFYWLLQLRSVLASLVFGDQASKTWMRGSCPSPT